MVEMSGPEHYKFMYETNYIYNESNPLNEHKVDLSNVHKMNQIIRAFKPYEKLVR